MQADRQLGWRDAGRLGAVFGALGGLWVALGDFGSAWLWLPVWRDRLGLLYRMAALLTPCGSLAGALLGMSAAACWQGSTGGASAAARASLVRFSTWFSLAWLPGLAWLARALRSGGMMSRLPAQGALQWALTAALGLLFWASVWALGRSLAAAQQRRMRARLGAAVLLAASVALGKANQLILPNLYLYLHAVLLGLSWLSASLGLWLWIDQSARMSWLRRRADQAWTVGVASLLLSVILGVNLVTLDSHLNVRVAMFSGRTPSSRAVLTAIDPLLRRPRTSRPRGEKAARALPSRTTTAPEAEEAHVLLITIDALRADHLSGYGYDRNTSPTLDALARTSVVFERAYAQAPHSSYSLTSLHTSHYTHELVDLDQKLPKATLASAFREAGYHTAAFFTAGIFHTEGHKLARYRDSAFDFALFDQTDREAEQQTDRVIEELDRIATQGEPKSLLWVHYFDVHEPYRDTRFGETALDRYDSEIHRVDREIARLFQAARQRLTRDLVIAITADHGEEFHDHGGVYHGSSLFDEQVRVPLILHAPKLPAQRVSSPVALVDLAPTLLQLTGNAVPGSMRGRDLRSLTRKDAAAQPVFSAVSSKRMVVQWPHKLIADLRFDLFELYDLSRDPRERENLADSNPRELRMLQDSLFTWLDSLEQPEPAANRVHGAYEVALRRGRIGDRRAVPKLGQLMLDRALPPALRMEAGQILTRLGDPKNSEVLYRATRTEPRQVAEEAAIALGRLGDGRARPLLRQLVLREDPTLRTRAALSLARLRDPSAVPGLIDALWVAPTQYQREEAVRWLGRLGDPTAIEPLLSVASEFNLRYLVAAALGELGNGRAFGPLMDMLERDRHPTVRDEVVRGLGLLADLRAIEPLTKVLTREPSLSNTAESLVRLGAIERGLVGGADLHPNPNGEGFRHCKRGPLHHDWDYRQRTHCEFGPRATLELTYRSRSAIDARTEQLLVRARRVDAPEAASVALSLSGKRLGELVADARWADHRLALPANLSTEPLALQLDVAPPAVIALDHVLIVPAAGN